LAKLGAGRKPPAKLAEQPGDEVDCACDDDRDVSEVAVPGKPLVLLGTERDTALL
jgi:hypothetical protein